MKHILFLFVLFFTISYLYAVSEQNRSEEGEVKKIDLNPEYPNLVSESNLNLTPGDTIVFISTGDDFALIIRNAKNFLEIDDNALIVRANSYLEDKKYVVKREPIAGEYKYEVFDITKNIWADAPPRIVVDNE